MRFAPIVVAATVAVTSSAYLAPAAQAQSETQTEIQPEATSAPVEQLVDRVAPPAVRIGDDLYILYGGEYIKADRGLMSGEKEELVAALKSRLSTELPGLAEAKEGAKEGKENSAKEDDTSSLKVVEWLVPLLVTGGIIAGLAGLFQKLYPSGRLILYYQPGKSITL